MPSGESGVKLFSITMRALIDDPAAADRGDHRRGFTIFEGAWILCYDETSTLRKECFMATIRIEVGQLNFEADLNQSATARKIAERLPLEGNANIWGDEIYFDIPLELELESDARAEVAVGDLGYWPVGSAFCIFFGPTPVSTDERPKAYSPVNVFGHITGDATKLKSVQDGALVRVTG
jgi:hypothetical protein